MARRMCFGRKWGRISLLFTIFLFGLYFEYLVYVKTSWEWDNLSCPSSSHCTKFLLVADPQLLGERDEPNRITIWDSDRYLYQTFSLALSHTQPDAVIFLGDLMDEGSRASDDEFQRYAERFSNIFYVNPGVKTFFLPGDNDIGGENSDPILPNVVHRFYQNFHKRNELMVNSCHLVKVNPVLETIPNLNSEQVPNDKYIKIAVSHFPLLGMSTPFTEKIVKNLQPHIIFSAHSHLSRLRGPSKIAPDELTRFGPLPIRPRNQMKTNIEDDWPITSNTPEVQVPTCSYRMGVSSMGYGYALIDETRSEVQYVVLRLPTRLQHLKAYLVAAAVCCCLFGCWCLCTCKRSHQKHKHVFYYP